MFEEILTNPPFHYIDGNPWAAPTSMSHSARLGLVAAVSATRATVTGEPEADVLVSAANRLDRSREWSVRRVVSNVWG